MQQPPTTGNPHCYLGWQPTGPDEGTLCVLHYIKRDPLKHPPDRMWFFRKKTRAEVAKLYFSFGTPESTLHLTPEIPLVLVANAPVAEIWPILGQWETDPRLRVTPFRPYTTEPVPGSYPTAGADDSNRAPTGLRGDAALLLNPLRTQLQLAPEALSLADEAAIGAQDFMLQAYEMLYKAGATNRERCLGQDALRQTPVWRWFEGRQTTGGEAYRATFQAFLAALAAGGLRWFPERWAVGQSTAEVRPHFTA